MGAQEELLAEVRRLMWLKGLTEPQVIADYYDTEDVAGFSLSNLDSYSLRNLLAWLEEDYEDEVESKRE